MQWFNMQSEKKRPVAEWEKEWSKGLVKMTADHKRLETAWNEYDTTVDAVIGSKRKHLERIAVNHGVSPSDVLKWYDLQPKDIERERTKGERR